MTIDPLAFHEAAVRTPSHEDVTEMRELLVETLAEAGHDPTVDDAGNTLATRTGSDTAEGNGSSGGVEPGPHLVLNTHIDTVPPQVPCSVDGGVVRGRGACDAKGPLAAMVDAFCSAEVSSGRLTLAVTPDEEVHSRGAAALDPAAVAPAATAPDAYVVGEPTDLDVCTAARGRFEGTLTIRGSAAHAATPASGQNAIRAAAPLLQAMETFDEERGPGEHEALGRPTLVPTRIQGGEAANQVPASCTITWDRRSVPPETADGFRAALEEHCYQWLPTGMDCAVALADRPTPFLEAFSTAPEAEIATALRRASGGEVRPFGAATEASFFAATAPTVVFGPGVLADDEGPVAHAEREYVEQSAIRDAADALRWGVAEFCG